MTDLVFPNDGPIIARDSDVNDFISQGWEAQADRLVIPVSRLLQAEHWSRRRGPAEVHELQLQGRDRR
jgi:hypothetical protein